MLKPALPVLSQAELDLTNLALEYFKVEDKPAKEMLTYSQKVIFYTLISKSKTRIQIIASTQYGKSLVVALACLFLSCIDGEMLSVIAPSGEKAKIIMRYYIEHLGDHSRLANKLERDTRLERLRKEESKERIVLNNGGGIFVVSAQERNSLKSAESAMGLGSKYTIMDEANLINDTTEATIFRMIAGKGAGAVYCKIGNPFYSSEPYSHFKKSWESNRYERIFIDDEIGLKEGRYTKEFLEEAKTKPLYSILFKSEFPPEDEIDKDGYRTLLTSSQIKRVDSVSQEELDKEQGDYILGVDIAGGGDNSVFVVRKGKYMWREKKAKTPDVNDNTDLALEIIEKYKIKDTNVFVDDTGIGRGVSDTLKNKGYFQCGVSFGSSAFRKDLFTNRRAEMYWDMAEWVKGGGIIVGEELSDFIELTWTKYKIEKGEKKIILEDKERIKKKFGHSPDTADASVLTFYKSKFIGFLG